MFSVVDLRLVWTAPTTTDRDRKELLRTPLEEVILNVEHKEKESHADLTLRWRGGMITKLDVHLKSYQVQGPKPRKTRCRCFVVWPPITRTMSSPAFSIVNSTSLHTVDNARPVTLPGYVGITTSLALNLRANRPAERCCQFKRLPEFSALQLPRFIAG
jgi:hypothetical protein